MATAHADPQTAQDRFADVVGRAAQVAHDVRALKTIAADAVEDGVYAARRAVIRGGREIEGLRETAAYRIKKAPFLAVAMAVGAGLLIGIVCGRCGRRASQQKP